MAACGALHVQIVCCTLVKERQKDETIWLLEGSFGEERSARDRKREVLFRWVAQVSQDELSCGPTRVKSSDSLSGGANTANGHLRQVFRCTGAKDWLDAWSETEDDGGETDRMNVLSEAAEASGETVRLETVLDVRTL